MSSGRAWSVRIADRGECGSGHRGGRRGARRTSRTGSSDAAPIRPQTEKFVSGPLSPDPPQSRPRATEFRAPHVRCSPRRVSRDPFKDVCGTRVAEPAIGERRPVPRAAMSEVVPRWHADDARHRPLVHELGPLQLSEHVRDRASRRLVHRFVERQDHGFVDSSAAARRATRCSASSRVPSRTWAPAASASTLSRAMPMMRAVCWAPRVSTELRIRVRVSGIAR